MQCSRPGLVVDTCPIERGNSGTVGGREAGLESSVCASNGASNLVDRRGICQLVVIW